MHRVTIQYDVPQDPEAFDERYFDHHVPLVAPIPGLHAFTWSKPRPLGGEHSVYLVAQLDFDGEEALERRPRLLADACRGCRRSAARRADDDVRGRGRGARFGLRAAPSGLHHLFRTAHGRVSIVRQFPVPVQSRHHNEGGFT